MRGLARSRLDALWVWIAHHRMDTGLALALGLLSFGVRVSMLGSDPYGDEAVHFHIARSFGLDNPRVVNEGAKTYLFVQRPLFSLLMWPGAILGFAAYRVWHMLFASALVVVVFGMLREQRVRPVLAAGAGLILTLHPTFVLWGLRVFPDTLMTLMLVLAVRAHLMKRPIQTGGFALAAVWIKEVAVVVVATLFIWSTVRAWIQRDFGLWPFRMDRMQTALGAALALSMLPLWLGISYFDGRFPGWSTNYRPIFVVDNMFLSLWLVPMVALGLMYRRTRIFAIVALALAAFFVYYRFGLGRGVDDWFWVSTGVLSLTAAAITFERSLSAVAARSRRGLNWAPVAIGAAGFVVLALQIVAPAGTQARELAYTSHDSLQPPLWSAVKKASGHTDLQEVVAWLEKRQPLNLLLADVGWFYVDYPFSDLAPHVGVAYTEPEIGAGVELWVEAIEEAANYTVLMETHWPMNGAIRETYAECVEFREGPYWVINGQNCAGRVGLARANLEKRLPGE